ncbi:folylpolyglutamate synthase, mitochondrial isoform X2 [Pyxicephalus adspersus]|uniref:folylpolyglutamate synthase, mitochondrial isoform X2 n=1 Tax=Pyxicephalus adspersus TaxID=30357 RepID=UPI003B5ADF09
MAARLLLTYILYRRIYYDAIRTLNTLQTNASYLDQVKRQRNDPQEQLVAMRGFLERSGLRVEDLDQLNIIHVTGTKGKGSTCAFTEQILRNYGLKTGFYSSPHLVQVRERIRINGQPISKELFSKYFWQVYNRLEESKHEDICSMPPYFRFLTIMAFHVFLQEKVDLAVLEVGIGGAYDCTNIIRKPIVCGISSLGIDHTSILGETIEKIAWQKGGIFKPCVPAFTAPQSAGPLQVLKNRAQDIGCPLYICPDLTEYEEEGKSLHLGLAGDHQKTNASLALQLAQMWLQQKGCQGFGEAKIPNQKFPLVKWPLPLAPVFHPSLPMVKGLQDTVWLGRTQVVQRGPISYYIDGAHTNSSVQACVRWFQQVAHNEEKAGAGSVVRVLLFNATGERDTAALLKLLQPCHFDYAVFCPNITEVTGVGIADQQNYNVTLENVLTRCLENQKKWNMLMEERSCTDPWASQLPVDTLIKDSARSPTLLLAPSSDRLLNCNSLVFPCISHALQWATQGRDPGFPCLDSNLLHHHPVASSGSVLLREAAHIQILIAGSLHLVGGALKLIDQTLTQ